MVKLIKTLTLSTLVLAMNLSAVLADEPAENKHVAVFIDKQDEADPQINVKVNGEKYEFTLPSLSEGETRSLSTTDGKAVVVSRKDNRITAKIGNETINLPNIMGKENELVASFHGKADGENKVLTKSFKIDQLGDLGSLKDTIVISGAKLSDDEQKKVKEALTKAGITKAVKFVGDKQVIAMVKDDNFEWHGDDDKDQNVVIVNSDGNRVEEKQIKIIRKSDQKSEDKKVEIKK